jgi:hypothetical protein
MVRLACPRTIQDERGQGLVEAAVAIAFLLMLVIGIFEVGQVFSAYIVLVNSVRDGALYASANPDLRNQVSESNCHAQGLTQEAYPNLYAYCERVKLGIITRRLDPDDQYLTIMNPIYEPLNGSPNRYRITVGAEYRLSTLFTSSISMPFFGRLGLPSSYTLSYKMVVESR